jgi:N-acetylglucosaminyldiphosphoundecaprenol N-acetyl-beta-D-mannosaminyltransferase
MGQDMSSALEQKKDLLGIKICDLQCSDLVSQIIDVAKHPSKSKVYYVNVNGLNIAYSCPRFRDSLSSSNLVFNDGFGVCLGAKVSGTKLRYRNTPPDWMDSLAMSSKDANLSLFFLGDEEGVARKAAEVMAEKHPGLIIAGTHHGFFNTLNNENKAVIDYINSTSADILLVGMGMPRQEFWIDENIELLNAHVYIPVGAAFRWYSGMDTRAPRWVTDHGLEWLARFIRHPKKLFRRYIVGNPLFFARLFRTHWLNTPLPAQCSRPVLAGCVEGCSFKKARPTA